VRIASYVRSDERCLAKVQALRGLHVLVELLERIPAGIEGELVQGQTGLPVDDLDWLGELLPRKGGAQNIVASDHRLQGAQESVQALTGLE